MPGVELLCTILLVFCGRVGVEDYGLRGCGLRCSWVICNWLLIWDQVVVVVITDRDPTDKVVILGLMRFEVGQLVCVVCHRELVRNTELGGVRVIRRYSRCV